MKVKILICTVVAGCVLGSVAFGDTVKFTGIVCSFDSSKITLQCGPDTVDIARTDSTKVISGTLKVGSTVTVQCTSTDAQRKEGVTTCTATPTPTPTPKPG
jgi:hypothetical protein